MVGRAAYAHPLRWTGVDAGIFGDASGRGRPGLDGGAGPDALRRALVRRGGRLWPIARHLVQVVEGVSGARHWRGWLTRAAGTGGRGSGGAGGGRPQLEERGL